MRRELGSRITGGPVSLNRAHARGVTLKNARADLRIDARVKLDVGRLPIERDVALRPDDVVFGRDSHLDLPGRIRHARVLKNDQIGSGGAVLAFYGPREVAQLFVRKEE